MQTGRYTTILAFIMTVSECSIFDCRKQEFAEEAAAAAAEGETGLTGEASDGDPGPPQPTTSTGTSTGEGTGDTTTDAVLPDLPDDAAPVEILEFSADVTDVTRPGPVTLTAEVAGEVQQLWLVVSHDETNFQDVLEWPVGSSTFEYIVNTSKRNGVLKFRLEATGEPGDTADLDVAVDMPPGGTLDQRWIGPQYTRGLAMATIPGASNEPDRVLVVGQNVSSGKLVAGVLEDDELELRTFETADDMLPHAVAVHADDGVFYVAGENNGDLVVRKYLLEHDLAMAWEFAVPDAAAHDIGLGPGGNLYVAGHYMFDGLQPYTDAALWIFDPDGGFAKDPVVFSEVDQFQQPLASGLTDFVLHDEWLVAVGFRSVLLGGDKHTLASIFEYTSSTLKSVHTITPNFDEEQSAWNSVHTTNDQFLTVGWYTPDDDLAETIAFGKFSLDFSETMVSPAWDGPGEAKSITWHTAGETVIAGVRMNPWPQFWVSSPSWASPYIDSSAGEASSVTVDRHGRVFALGSDEQDGPGKLTLVRLFP